LPGAGVIPAQQPAQIGETLPAHAGAAGNTEGKIMDTHDPRNDSGVRSLDGAKLLHKTPALIRICPREHSESEALSSF